MDFTRRTCVALVTRCLYATLPTHYTRAVLPTRTLHARTECERSARAIERLGANWKFHEYALSVTNYRLLLHSMPRKPGENLYRCVKFQYQCQKSVTIYRHRSGRRIAGEDYSYRTEIDLVFELRRAEDTDSHNTRTFESSPRLWWLLDELINCLNSVIRQIIVNSGEF